LPRLKSSVDQFRRRWAANRLDYPGNNAGISVDGLQFTCPGCVLGAILSLSSTAVVQALDGAHQQTRAGNARNFGGSGSGARINAGGVTGS